MSGASPAGKSIEIHLFASQAEQKRLDDSESRASYRATATQNAFPGHGQQRGIADADDSVGPLSFRNGFDRYE